MKEFLSRIGSPFSRECDSNYLLIDAPEPDELNQFSLDSFIQPTSLFKRLIKTRDIDTALREQDLEELEQTKHFFQTLYKSIHEGTLSKQISLYEELNISYVEAVCAEVVSKVLSYREHIEGNTIHVPHFFKDKWTQHTYKINFIYLKNKLPVLILNSEDPNAPLWIAPRGTSPYFGMRKGSLESLYLDFNKKDGIDLSPVKSLHKKSSSLITPNRQLIICGHSLGGLLAQKIAVDHAHLAPFAYTYGAPGIDKSSKLHYEELKKKPKITQFLTEGDPIPSSGRFFIGNVYAIHIRDYKNNFNLRPFSHHTRLSLNQPHSIHKVNIELEEKTYIRNFMESRIRAGLFRKLMQPLKKFR